MLVRGKDHLKTKSKKLILFCNPNGLCYEYLVFGSCFLEIFFEKNYDVVLWNYRGYGKRNGSPDFPNMTADAEEILNYIQSKESYESIGLYGYSLGGSIACKLASDKSRVFNIKLLIADRTFSSLENVAKSKINYDFVSYILKILWISESFNSEYYISPNEEIKRVCLNDPDDDVIDFQSSLFRGIQKSLKDKYVFPVIKKLAEENKKASDITQTINTDNTKSLIIESYNNASSDIIRNKFIFTNIEFENFKDNFLKTLIFIIKNEEFKLEHFKEKPLQLEQQLVSNKEISRFEEYSQDKFNKADTDYSNHEHRLAEEKILASSKDFNLFKIKLRDFIFNYVKGAEVSVFINNIILDPASAQIDDFINVTNKLLYFLLS